MPGVLLILAVCTGCEAYAEPTYPGAGDAPADNGYDTTAVGRPQAPPPPSHPAPEAHPGSSPTDPVVTRQGGAEEGKSSDDRATREQLGRPATSIRLEIRQLESLLRVLRSSAMDRPRVVRRLADDYDELSRVADSDEERAKAAARADQVRTMAPESQGAQ